LPVPFILAQWVLPRSRRVRYHCRAAFACREKSANFSRITMNITLAITPLISLIAGILILVMPKLLNYIIALYLIIIGIIGLVK
jgi:hypothetical protein